MCVPMDSLDGGKIIDSSIIGGTTTNVTLTGTTQVDAASAQSLADALAPLLDGKIGGLTQEELKQAIADLFLSGDGNALTETVKSNIQALIVSNFETRLKNYDGLPLPSGSELMTRTEIEHIIDDALGGAGSVDVDADKITNVQLGLDNRLTISTQNTDGSFGTYSADMSALAATLTAAAPVATVQGVPLSAVGSDTAFLGAPLTWGRLVIGGVSYRIPLYAG